MKNEKLSRLAAALVGIGETLEDKDEPLGVAVSLIAKALRDTAYDMEEVSGENFPPPEKQ